MLAASLEQSVPFYDVDPMRVMWHGHYAKYFELCSSELLDRIDYNYQQMEESGYAWPIVDMRIQYVQPVRFGQRIIITAELEEWVHRLKVRYHILDADNKQRLTKGYTVQVAVALANGEMQLTAPAALEERMRRAEEGGLGVKC